MSAAASPRASRSVSSSSSPARRAEQPGIIELAAALAPALKIARYRERTAMPAHAHDEPWLCLLLEGDYSERILTRTTEHAPGALLFCPAHTPHAQRIGRDGAVK